MINPVGLGAGKSLLNASPGRLDLDLLGAR